MRADTIPASAIEPTPTVATVVRLMRGPRIASSNALANGIAGISQTSPSKLPSHFARRIGIERLPLTVQLQQQGQTHRNFRRCHRQNENEHNLAICLGPARARNDEGEACRVQHDLYRHQDENQVTTDEKADQSQRK